MTVKAVWHIVKESARSIGVAKLRRAICDGPMLGSYATEASWSRSNFFLGHVSVQTTELYLGCKQPDSISR